MDNKIKLGKNERMIGAHILKEETDHYKISQIKKLYSFRVHKLTAVGMFIDECLKGGETGWKWLEMLIMDKVQNLGTVPDEQFLKISMKETTECIKRHTEWYGVKTETLSKEQDDEMLKEEMMDYYANKALKKDLNKE